MSVAQMLLPEFDREIATTRRLLERVATETFDFKPHPKSGTMQWLAGHVALLPMWAVETMAKTELDLNPSDGSMEPPPAPTTTEELLQMFDTQAAAARAAIAGGADEDFMVDWTLLNAGEPVFTMPRVAVIRVFVMNPLIHHRGQLSVYLRLNDIPVPSIYGPSADEEAF